jgi:hypothetical protein
MIELRSMAVAMPEVTGHPNRIAFEGVLTMVDVASQRPPSGAKGHLVMLTRSAAEAALPSLLGMALDYSPGLDRHDMQRKVGVITRAEIVGRSLEAGGYLYARDFPEIVEEIAKSGRGGERRSVDSSRDRTERAETMNLRAEGWTKMSGLRASLRIAAAQILRLKTEPCGSPRDKPEQAGGSGRTIRAEALAAAGPEGLGLSYEVTDVRIEDARARVWALSKVTFTGAAILRRDKAAYRDTWIELST